MATIYQQQQVRSIIATLNKRFNIAIHPEEFDRPEYSASSLRDMLIQRVQDELSGEWTTEKAMNMLRKAWSKISGTSNELPPNMVLEELIAKKGRQAQVKKWAEAAGVELDILRPARLPQGILIFIVFASIPLGLSMDWFLSGVLIMSSLAGLWMMNKTASQFKYTTLEEMAEAVAWKYYLQQQKGKAGHTQQGVTAAVDEVLQ
jgi:hypothetical protein